MSTALISNSLIEIWFTYQEHRAALVRLQREQADSRFPAIPQLIGTLEAAHHFGKAVMSRIPRSGPGRCYNTNRHARYYAPRAHRYGYRDGYRAYGYNRGPSVGIGVGPVGIGVRAW
jgi:hypothetical protein